MRISRRVLPDLFQSTLPTRGSDADTLATVSLGGYISIHAPHEGERQERQLVTVDEEIDFNPRSPRGGATVWADRQSATRQISIHAPHEGERHPFYAPREDEILISIHAPHEGERLNGGAYSDDGI